ncbi:hypothetical protein [Cellulomonas chengniuliangii]|uniref:Uncharacterized protein n=1 Tax=Cellulomonas chengniuliangii TaxID=2968084 RepID=A0ABY5KYK0_9CELL|nr:hypothetical protein [Cellulomonas chengniuliangii]MCC2309714.1 hypothetical protein [Cellulomonas chengniuliangii]MCC2319010.1 hypothetical protein [Cellulomonas chengniuliangii]UUI74739.1 hypothetical protein NP064_13225 [Cellulomonas chengniuliangii]
MARTTTDQPAAPGRVYRILRWVTIAIVISWLVGAALRGEWLFVTVAGAALLAALGMWWVGRSADIRRQRQFEADFGGSLDAVRASLDAERLRGVRDTHGEVEAVRRLREGTPQVSLLQAVELVRSL